MGTHKSGCTYLFFYSNNNIYVQTVEGGQGEKVYPKALVSSFILGKERHEQHKAFLMGETKEYLDGLKNFLCTVKSYTLRDGQEVPFFTSTAVEFILNKEAEKERELVSYDQACRRLYVFGLLVKLGYYPLNYSYVDSFTHKSKTDDVPMFKAGFYTRIVVYGLNRMHSSENYRLKLFKFNGKKDIPLNGPDVIAPPLPNYKQDVGDVKILTLEEALTALRRDKSFKREDLDYELMLKTARVFIKNLPQKKQQMLQHLKVARDSVYFDL